MAFKGYHPNLPEKISSWHLPWPVIREFTKTLEHLPRTPTARLPDNADDLLFVADVDDFVEPRAGYLFQARIGREGDDFWVSDILCTEVNAAGDVIWVSDNELLDDGWGD